MTFPALKAPKGRNVIAWGTRHRKQVIIIMQALKGRNIYVALSGLNYLCVSLTQGVALGYYITPLQGFQRLSRIELPLSLRFTAGSVVVFDLSVLHRAWQFLRQVQFIVNQSFHVYTCHAGILQENDERRLSLS
jgi:hypothetical protein